MTNAPADHDDRPAPIPADAIPADAIPADAIPADAIPSDDIPADAIPSDDIGADDTGTDAIGADAIGAGEETTGGAPARQSRGGRDMTLSLLVLLIPIAIIVALVGAPGGDDPVVVDPGPAIVEAQVDNAFPVAVPTGLDSGWKAVSSVYSKDGSTLRIGYVTPAGRGVQLIESGAATDGLLIQELGDDTRPQGVVTAGPASWNSYQVRNGQRALVRAGQGRTIIVIGSADLAELVDLAAAVS